MKGDKTALARRARKAVMKDLSGRIYQELIKAKFTPQMIYEAGRELETVMAGDDSLVEQIVCWVMRRKPSEQKLKEGRLVGLLKTIKNFAGLADLSKGQLVEIIDKAQFSSHAACPVSDGDLADWAACSILSQMTKMAAGSELIVLSE